MTTENLSTLKIHKLSQAQYERELEAGRIDESALYLTPDEDIDLSNYATKDELSKKADIAIIEELEEALESKIYTENDEPENAPDGSLWIDLDEEGASIEIPDIDLEGYATEEYVDNAVSSIPQPDFEATEGEAGYVLNRPGYRKVNKYLYAEVNTLDRGSYCLVDFNVTTGNYTDFLKYDDLVKDYNRKYDYYFYYEMISTSVIKINQKVRQRIKKLDDENCYFDLSTNPVTLMSFYIIHNRELLSDELKEKITNNGIWFIVDGEQARTKYKNFKFWEYIYTKFDELLIPDSVMFKRDMGDYATTDYVDDAVASVDVPDVDLTGYATEKYVDDAIAAIDIPSGGSGGIDLGDFRLITQFSTEEGVSNYEVTQDDNGNAFELDEMILMIDAQDSSDFGYHSFWINNVQPIYYAHSFKEKTEMTLFTKKGNRIYFIGACSSEGVNDDYSHMACNNRDFRNYGITKVVNGKMRYFKLARHTSTTGTFIVTILGR